MGFSVSGATAIIFLGLFVATGTAVTAVANGYGAVTDAQQDRADRVLEERNTAITITDITVGTDESTITIDNDGSAGLAVSATTVLVDGEIATVTSSSVNGSTATDLWLPRETLTLTVDRTGDRYKVVTGTGVATTEVR